jgi:hypothetical protein
MMQYRYNFGENKMKKLFFRTLLLILIFAVPSPTMAEMGSNSGIPLPPPIEITAPPEVIVLPGTYVYVIPELNDDLFFNNGWWWRLWEGRWYRSRHYYDSDWIFYESVPPFFARIPLDWREEYRYHRWRGHPWNYRRIKHEELQQNWEEWEKNNHWEKEHNWDVQDLKPLP